MSRTFPKLPVCRPRVFAFVLILTVKGHSQTYTNRPSPPQKVTKLSIKYRDIYVEDYIPNKISKFTDGKVADIIYPKYKCVICEQIFLLLLPVNKLKNNLSIHQK